MITLHIENTVHDYESWKAAFDKFDRFRADQGVRSYRLTRRVEDGNQVAIDLTFDTAEEATAFRGALEQIWRTPQSQEQLVAHGSPTLHELVEERVPTAAAPSAV
ncbi:hypothetical protein EFK50_12445 [Nocardioides marmoriginsengisoli]|uniref:Cyclase n=1 Tax=Nocardioides marmoriginsengisoli TaxID=661483 RepID=A0A3N0CGX1_9ACTN|nr:hypothetical protein [Nocardioides marmoriginsengisoli]RNL62569.1 hypothetical protein EFK50_12445 [Nocardioides marmoriginsengisoli]